MERNANYALVGAVAILIVVGFVAFLVWLAGLDDKQYDYYDVYLPAPVQGLQRGAVVFYNGVQVGDVTQIQLLPQYPQRVRSRLRIGRPSGNQPSPVPTTAVAQLEPQLITGVSSISLSVRTTQDSCAFETQNAQALRNLPRDPVPILCARQNPLAGLLGSANAIAANADQALQAINRLLSRDNVATLTRTLNNVEAVTAELNQRRAMIGDLQRTIVTLNSTAQQFRSLAASSQRLTDRDAPQALGQIRMTAAEAQRTAAAATQTAEAATRTAAEAQRLVRQLEGTTSAVNSNVLPQLTTTLESVQDAAETLNRAAAEVQENPRGLIRRGQSAQREIPQ